METLPWTIQRQLQQSENDRPQGQQQRRSGFLEDKWALRRCHQCHEVGKPGRVCGSVSAICRRDLGWWCYKKLVKKFSTDMNTSSATLYNLLTTC